MTIENNTTSDETYFALATRLMDAKEMVWLVDKGYACTIHGTVRADGEDDCIVEFADPDYAYKASDLRLLTLAEKTNPKIPLCAFAMDGNGIGN